MMAFYSIGPLHFVVLQVIQGLGHETRARNVFECHGIIVS
jgi:hypothetical protein